MLRRLLSQLMILLALFVLSASAHAGNRPEQHLHFTEEANWPPFTPNRYGYVREGLSFALIRSIFSRLNYTVDLELVPQNRMLHYLQTGQKDGATIISINQERKAYIAFSEPLFRKTGYIYSLAKGKPFVWQTYKDLKEKRIGITSGHNYGDEFTQAVKQQGLTVEETTTDEQNFQKLLSGRVDLVLCIDHTARTILQRPEFREKFSHAAKPYFEKAYHVGLSKKSPARDLMPQINEVIRQMQEDGTLDAIITRHLLR